MFFYLGFFSYTERNAYMHTSITNRRNKVVKCLHWQENCINCIKVILCLSGMKANVQSKIQVEKSAGKRKESHIDQQYT